MSERFHDSGRKSNIHAPWRMEYISSLSDDDKAGCFLCRARDETDRQAENLLLWRTADCIVVMNKFPYTGGHLLIAPAEHVGEMAEIDGKVLREMMELARDSQKLLTRTLKAEGFNMGINVGRCAGAGLPDHLHLHVVPRWSGDTNYMAVLGDVRVIPQALSELRRQLLDASREMKLPKV